MRDLPFPPLPPADPQHGHLGQLRADRLGFLTETAHTYGDVVQIHFGEAVSYLVNRPDLIEKVLLHTNTHFIKGYSDDPILRTLLGNGLLNSEGSFWLRQRRLIQPTFHRNRIASYQQIMVDYTERALSEWRDGQRLELHGVLMQLTLEIVAKALFGEDLRDKSQGIGEALTAALKAFFDRDEEDDGELPEGFLKAVASLDAVVYELIERRRSQPTSQSDLISVLLGARDDEGQTMTDQQLRDEVMTLLLAGHETTANALSWAWLLISQHPAVWEGMHREAKALAQPLQAAELSQLSCCESVLKEAMRLYPPVWAFSRVAKEDLELGGFALPAGTGVLLSQWVTHRDPRYFPEPLAFRPERWQAEGSWPRHAYFPFGGGPRLCIGNNFAMLEGTLISARIAREWRLRWTGEEVTPLPAITLRPFPGVWVTLERVGA
jgi:cytochrome P450